MTLKDQWKNIKNNWLIIVLVLVLVVLMNIGGTFSGIRDLSYSAKNYVSQGVAGDSSYAPGYDAVRVYPPSPSYDFAPDATVRKVTKSASISTEVERGQFDSAQQRLKDVISSSDSYLLNENVNKYGLENREYHQGYYSIKVDTKKYDSVVSQLKGIGKIQSFSESSNDITGQYTNAQINLDNEKARLERYKALYDQAKDVNDKININDRLFSQEQTIKYLEDSMKNIDERIDYTTISFSMTEKQSGYADVVVVKFSALIRNMVSSFNSLLTFIFTIIPWVALLLVGVFVWRLARRNDVKKR